MVPGQIIRDPEMDADEEQAEADRKRLDDDGNEGVDVDPDAAAYIRSRQDVLKLRQARKNQWALRKAKRKVNHCQERKEIS